MSQSAVETAPRHYLSTVALSQFIRSMNWAKNRDNKHINYFSDQIGLGIDLLKKNRQHSLETADVNRYVHRLETIRACLQTGAVHTISLDEATEIADFFKGLPIE